MTLKKFLLSVFVGILTFGVGLVVFGFISSLSGGSTPAEKEAECLTEPVAPQRVVPLIELKELPAAPTVVTEAEEDASCELSVTGDYGAIGPVDKKFEGFEGLDIVVDVYDQKLEKFVPVKPSGSIYWRKQELKLSSIKVDGTKVHFVTKTRKGVSFQFDGKRVSESYREKDLNGESYDQAVDLKGKLIRFENGKKVAETRIKFEAYCGC